MRRNGTAAVGVLGVAGTAAAVLRRRKADHGTNTTTRAITVGAPPDQVRAAWDARTGDPTGSAQVEFRPAVGGRATEIRVRLSDDQVDGTGGSRLRGETPDQRVREELRRFKSEVECGEVVTTEGQPTGRSSRQEAVTRAITDRMRAWGPA